LNNQYTDMSIKVGDKAPDFTLVTKAADGPALFTLSEHVGSSNILILFVPMAFTGVCTTEFCDISNGIAEYEALNAKVIGISGDNPFAQAAWAEKEGITIPLLSDYEHTAAKTYGVAYEQFLPEANLIMGGVPKRSAFVVDKNGIVQYAEVQEHPKDLPNFDAIKETLKSL
jgi:peroxiredoxin